MSSSARILAAAFIAAAAFSSQASGASYPDRAIRIVVPFPAGGPTDTVARKIGDGLSQRLGQSVVVENRPGANTIIGADAVAKSRPDGYTLLLTNTGVVQNPWLYKTLPYDLDKDLTAVAQLVQAPLVLTVNGSLPVTSLKTLVEYEKANPDKTAYASTSIGGTTNIYGEQMKRLYSLNTVHVPYKGDPAVLPDLLSNRVQWYFATASQVAQYIDQGRLRALGVTGKSRLAAMPDVPTMLEQGHEGFETVAWYGVFAPSGTPQDVLDKLGTEITAIVKSPEMTKFFNDNMFVPAALGAKEFSAVVKDDLLKWKDLIQSNHIKIE